MPYTFHKPWPHAITDNVMSKSTFDNLIKQLDITLFSRFQARPSDLGMKQSWQYKMDGYRNRLPNDDGLLDLNEILDYNTLMAMWDETRNQIYSIHHDLEPEGLTPFKEINIEFHRVLGVDDAPVSRVGANRMDNYIMVDLAEGLSRSLEKGFSIWNDSENKEYTVSWSRNRMLSYCGRTGVTYLTPPRNIKGRKFSYFNIALR